MCVCVCVYYPLAAFADGHWGKASPAARSLPRYSWILKNLKACPLTAIKSRSRPPQPPPPPEGKGFRPRNIFGARPRPVGSFLCRTTPGQRSLVGRSVREQVVNVGGGAAASRTLSDNRYMSACRASETRAGSRSECRMDGRTLERKEEGRGTYLALDWRDAADKVPRVAAAAAVVVDGG